MSDFYAFAAAHPVLTVILAAIAASGIAAVFGRGNDG